MNRYLPAVLICLVAATASAGSKNTATCTVSGPVAGLARVQGTFYKSAAGWEFILTKNGQSDFDVTVSLLFEKDPGLGTFTLAGVKSWSMNVLQRGGLFWKSGTSYPAPGAAATLTITAVKEEAPQGGSVHGTLVATVPENREKRPAPVQLTCTF